MSGKEPAKIAREFVNAFNTANWTTLKGFLTPDAIYSEVGTQRKIQGPDQIVKTFQDWKRTMTDAKGTVTNALDSDVYGILEINWQGTQDGPFNGPSGTIPPSGKRQTTPAALIVKLKGDKVQEIHHYFDMLSF